MKSKFLALSRFSKNIFSIQSLINAYIYQYIWYMGRNLNVNVNVSFLTHSGFSRASFLTYKPSSSEECEYECVFPDTFKLFKKCFQHPKFYQCLQLSIHMVHVQLSSEEKLEFKCKCVFPDTFRISKASFLSEECECVFPDTFKIFKQYSQHSKFDQC